MQTLVAALCGLVFGAGLAISGMTNPAKVIGFLDVLGNWDPTLAFVMGSALAVSALGYLFVRGRDRSLLGGPLVIPDRTDLDPALLGGAALFGIGWGLVGLCPGPAIAGLLRAEGELLLFVAGMVAGAFGHRLAERLRTATSPS